jgi:hypothetical protein
MFTRKTKQKLIHALSSGFLGIAQNKKFFNSLKKKNDEFTCENVKHLVEIKDAVGFIGWATFEGKITMSNKPRRNQ